MTRHSTVVVVLASAYVGAQILADVASLRIVAVAGITMDGGTLIYPFTFTLRDLVHKAAGIATARALIFTAAGLNVVMAVLFFIVAALPPDLTVGPQIEFGAVLSPVYRIVVASIIAEIVSELVDTEVYRRWVDRFSEKWQWGRVLTSNAVAIPIDSVIFAVIAFGGVIPAAAVGAIIWGNILVKVLVTVISIPSIYAVKPGPVEMTGADSG